MKITRRQLRRIIRESISAKEASKIESLWWSRMNDADGLLEGPSQDAY